MNREEILSQLTELQKRISSEVDGYNIENRVATIEEINEQLKSNERIIKYLSERLENDSNYIDKTPIQYFNMQIAAATELLNSKKSAELQNYESISREQAIVDNFTSLIEQGKVEVSKLTEDNIGLDLAIRRANLSKDDAKVQAYQAEKTANESRIRKIEEERENLTSAISEHTKVITELQSHIEELHEQFVNAEANLAEIRSSKAEVKAGRIDLSKKAIEESQLVFARETHAALERKSELLSYDFSGELSQIISEYSNSSITDEELVQKLTDLKGRLPKDFISNDAEIRNAELEANLRAQEVASLEIESLERRLSNENNYKLTPAQLADRRFKVSKLNSDIKTFETLIARAESENLTASSDIDIYNEIIRLCDEEIDKLSEEIEINMGVDDDLVSKLEKTKSLQFQIKKEAEEEIAKINELGLGNESVLADLKAKKERCEKLLVSAQEKAKAEDGLDLGKHRLDEINLQKAKAGLEALRSRESFLKDTVVISIDKIIGSVSSKGTEFNGNSQGNDEIFPFPLSDSVDVDEAQNALDDEELTLDDETLSVVNGFNNADVNSDSTGNFENPEDEIIEEDAELEDGPIAITSTSEDIDENLQEKSKAAKFVEAAKDWWKKHWKKALLTVALVAGIALGARGCNNQNVNQAEISNPSIETTFETNDNLVTDEDIINDIVNDENSTEVTNDDQTITNDQNENIDENQNLEQNNQDNNVVDQNQNSNENNTNDNQPYTEQIPGDDMTPAESVDPSTIVDEHPEENVVIPEASPNQGEVNEGTTGVTGNETVPEDAWENEDPVIVEETQTQETQTTVEEAQTPVETQAPVEENQTQDTQTPVVPTEGTTGVTGNETVPEDAWDIGDFTFEDENVTSPETEVVQTPDSAQENQTTAEETQTPVETQAPVEENQTQDTQNISEGTIEVREGDALIIDNAAIGNEAPTVYVDGKDNIMSVDGVLGVSYKENEGQEVMNITVNNNDDSVVRDNPLTDEDIASIQEENNISQQEIDDAEAQWRAANPELAEQLDKLKEARDVLTSTNSNEVVEQSSQIQR